MRRVSGAEPPVVGLTPQTTDITDNRKTDTMKTYILRRAKGVEEFWAGRGKRRVAEDAKGRGEKAGL